MADLTFTYGLMGSGKSVAAINRILSLRSEGLEVQAFTGQSRVSETITDRTGRSVSAAMFDRNTDLCWPAGNDVVVVDEAQFLSWWQVRDLVDMAGCGTDVHCYGLLTDFKRQFFPGALELLRYATFTESLTPPVCDLECGRPAYVNARLVNGLVTKHGPQVLVGDVGAEYAVLCGECYG